MIPTVPPIDMSNPNALIQIMIDKELTLIHGIFGTDLEEVIVCSVTDKDGWKCQSAVAKAARKCQDARLATYNRCKKDQLRAGVGNAQALQDACLGANGAQCPDAYHNALCDEELNGAGCGGVCCP